MTTRSDSEQSGAGTRGADAGSGSQTIETGAGSGVTSAQARHTGAGAEVTSDIGQAEKYITDLNRQGGVTDDARVFLNGHYARLATLAEFSLAQSHDLAARIKNNGASHDANMNSVNQSERERTVRIGDKTTSIDLATLVALSDAGMLSVPKGGK